jgi:RND family efflux transporter MFP subunit
MLAFLHRHLWRILALVILSGVVAFVLALKGRTSEAAAASGTRGSANVNVNYETLGDIVFPVEIDTVRRGTLTTYITANGSVRAAQSVDIVARISGFVELLPPVNGSAVSKGQTIVRFDRREAALALKEADDKRIQAQVEFGLSFRDASDTGAAAQARQEHVQVASARVGALLARLDSLRASQQISAKEYAERRTLLDAEMLYTGAQRSTVIQSKSGLSAAKNALEKAQLQLEYCTVQAPFSGVVANSSLAVGQYVQVGQTLCKILDVSSLLMDVGVLETELPFVHVGTKAEASFQALPGIILHGTVTAINPLADAASKTYTVTVRLDGGANTKRIAPGMFATVRLAAEELRNRVLLPKAALLSRDKRNVVFSVAGSPDKPTAQWNYVETGRANDRFIEVQGGLEAGAVVMTEGHYTLAHGAAVRIETKAVSKTTNRVAQ